MDRVLTDLVELALAATVGVCALWWKVMDRSAEPEGDPLATPSDFVHEPGRPHLHLIHGGLQAGEVYDWSRDGFG